MLRERGAFTFSADEAARAVLNKDGPALREIVDRFGPEILTAAGSLDRTKLGRLVFSDSHAREALNRIMHPRIRLLQREHVQLGRLQ